MQIHRVLDGLEKHYGKRKIAGPSDAYGMVLYSNCGYPANDLTCPKGFTALQKLIGLQPDQILAASETQLAQIMRLGGIVPEIRSRRLKEIAGRVRDKFAGDLDAVLQGPLADARKALKQFPTIGDPGADKILLFTGTAPVAAIPSGHVHVFHRLGLGSEKKSYAAGYRSAQEALQTALPAQCATLQRAYLLLQHHGREICKRSAPRCDACPVTRDCGYFQKSRL
jgi:endonuclease III